MLYAVTICSAGGVGHPPSGIMSIGESVLAGGDVAGTGQGAMTTVTGACGAGEAGGVATGIAGGGLVGVTAGGVVGVAVGEVGGVDVAGVDAAGVDAVGVELAHWFVGVVGAVDDP